MPLKRGPKVPANLTSAVLEDEIVAWRKRLAEDGLDAGARTISLAPEPSRAQVPALLDHPPGAPAPWLRRLPSPRSGPARAGRASSRRCPTRPGSPT